MSDLIKTDIVFGKRVNVVGNISADLVLESLGKVYIKSRNKALTLEELITSLVTTDPNTSTSRVEVVEGIEGLDLTAYKEGTFVFDKLSNILYLFLDGELLELINVAPEGTGYVKRSGDTMSGRLAIYVKNGPPLYVNSSTLVENLNAQYLDGDTAETFTRKHRNEQITGMWTFRNSTKFKGNISAEKDIVINGSIGTPTFASGFGGYGWRMDADTNTLTVDNLVVRKLMKVYELVVNKISATNGSLWVSNAGKVVFVLKLDIYPPSFFSDSVEYRIFCNSAYKDFFFIKYADNMTDSGSGEYSIDNMEDLPPEAFDTASGYGRIIKVCLSLKVLKSMLLVRVLEDKKDLVREFNNFTGDITAQTTSNGTPLFNKYNLFDPDFKFGCVFPIVNRENKLAWDDAMYALELAKNSLATLILLKSPESVIEALRANISNLLAGANPNNFVTMIKSYYKYFGGGDFYVVKFDDDELPVFKPGDLLRCLKWTYGGIKYYDAVVCNYIDDFFVIQLADSILDKKTTISYDSSLNPTYTIEDESYNMQLYNTTIRSPLISNNLAENVNMDADGNVTTLSAEELFKENLLGLVEEKDGLVLMGHLWDALRQNAVYITSTDDAAPYMDVLSGINRPDYSVIYYVPVYQTTKLYLTSYDLRTFTGFNNLVEIPYTGEYYVLDSTIPNFTCEYVSFKSNNKLYLAKGKQIPNSPGVYLLYYLNTIPDKCTMLGGDPDNFYITLENGGKILLQSGEGAIILEHLWFNLELASTRTVKARFGNLDGIKDEFFPLENQPHGYGLYGLNVFLTGEFYLSNGLSVADLGKDAMAFAVASSLSGNAAINLLRTDLTRADNLLKASHYSKGTLKTAGMYVGNDDYGNPGIVIWGNKILFATNDAEFSGLLRPTMLLLDGKILGKYLGVDEAHANNIANVPLSTFTVGNDSYVSADIGDGTVRVFRPKVRNPSSPSGTSYYEEGNEVYYVRRFIKNNTTIVWLLVNPDGYPTTVNLFGIYTQVTYPTFIYYDAHGNSYTYSNGILPSDVEALFVSEFTTPLKVWSLEVNGNANIGGHTLYVDARGLVVVSGILRSSEGNIGGLFLSNNGMFTYDSTYSYNPVDLNTFDYGWGDNNSVSIPYIKFMTGNNGIPTHTTVMNAKGLFYLALLNLSSSYSWSDFISLLVPAIVYSLTVIPIVGNDNRLTMYARLSGGGSFSGVYMCFNAEGRYCYYLNQIIDEDWFAKQLRLGTLHFSVSGYNQATVSMDFDGRTNTINPNKLEYRLTSYNNSYAFNAEYMIDNPSIDFCMTDDRDWYWKQNVFKASIDQVSIHASTYKFNSQLVDNVDCRHLFPYGCMISGNEDNSYRGYYDGGGVWNLGSSDRVFVDGEILGHRWTNATLVTVSDDDSPNFGGFTVTCWYMPSFDTRYIQNTELHTPDFNLEYINDYNNQLSGNNQTNPTNP